VQKLVGSLIAIGVASVAAIAATSAMLDHMQRIGPATSSTPGTTTPPSQTPVPPDDSGKPAMPQGTPEPGKPAAPGGAADPAKPASVPAAGAPGAAEGDEVDKDPYEGIAPEELPPDLQYNADSSVSFPTNI
jgi:hypothetical protein